MASPTASRAHRMISCGDRKALSSLCFERLEDLLDLNTKRTECLMAVQHPCLMKKQGDHHVCTSL